MTPFTIIGMNIDRKMVFRVNALLDAIPALTETESVIWYALPNLASMITMIVMVNSSV